MQRVEGEEQDTSRLADSGFVTQDDDDDGVIPPCSIAQEQFAAEQQHRHQHQPGNKTPSKQQQDTDNPFAWCLHCQTVPDQRQQKVLWWFSPARAVPTDVERALTPLLVPYRAQERGMFKTQSVHRLRQVKDACRQHQIDLRAALSLRRHLMRQHNPHLSLPQLGLGSNGDVNEAAYVFEEAVRKELERCKVDFYAEDEQKRYIQEHKTPDMPYPPTPDFIFKKTVRIKKYFTRKKQRSVLTERSINCK